MMMFALSEPSIWAQTSTVPPVIDPTGRSGEPPASSLQEPSQVAKPSRPVLPSLEQLREEIVGVPPIQVFVKELKVVGYTVFSDQEIHAITDPYQNRLLTTEDIEAVRRALTLLYVEKGYINSGARIPDQGVEEGVVTLEIIEGTLDEIDVVVEGAKHFHPFYFRSRIRLGVEEPLNVRPLQERLQLLLLDSRVERLNSELKPGSTLGSSELDVRVKEASPYRAWAEFNNFQSPTVGAERGLGTVAHQNLLGLGDEFQFTYGQSEGLDPLIDGSYTLPITPYDTTLAFQYRRNKFEDVSDAFKDLDIKSKTNIFTFTLRQPVYRTLQDEVALSLTGEYLENKTSLLGSGFAFTPGYNSNGKAKITALRFGQEWTRRQSNQVLAIRSRLSMGLDIFGATNERINSDDPDSHFLVWLGQAQWVRRIDPWDIQFLTSTAIQIANDSLFPLQQFAVGGRFSVRGYRENTLVRDNAFLFSVETRLPVLPSFFGENVVYFAPFVDVGHSWNVHLDTIRPQDTLASVGAGVRINLFDRAQANVYWGMQLNHVPDPPDNNSLQDNGVHVQFVWNLF
jgi:hemolysin activation/secretion protein